MRSIRNSHSCTGRSCPLRGSLPRGRGAEARPAGAVTGQDHQEAGPEELKAFTRYRLAAYQYPRSLWLVDALPKGPTGKILRREVDPPAD